jgi:mono/diheme cytochrome c family protein
LTEVPDYLLQRSRERRAALGLGGGDADAGAPAADAAVPAVAEAAAPAAAAPAPEIEKVEPPKPVAPWVQAAQERKKIPVWMAPVALFLPIWAFMVWGTLEEPTREAEGPIAAGDAIYAAACATCHGGGGGGGVGYQLNDGEVLLTFPDVESQVAWVVNGTENTSSPTYGDPDRPGGQRQTGGQGNMPAFASLGSTEVMEVVLYERLVHGLESEAHIEPYLLWVESGELPEWETGVSTQAIAADFAAFVAGNAEAAEALEAAEAEG